MNQLIKKLAEQSGFFPVPDETEVDWEYRAENARYEKFAELIVKECLDIASKTHETKYGKMSCVNDGETVRLIKEHFGIE